ncbi:hypothetical protein Cob_v013161 [Colletotrichum orbiculare MAFF 240422]|uniref:Uncharacterized protein n=1 Tax=Colletotrichum orbiculare (strain 104-T / ATCC 96160 / CBS 514.97 / LARS 414 / MAFF 240422) TaxID=1213857 RepID=N4W631_COLOR|nr:hypothetical protein Cob_v013161 [Colletotrichum orbiculare MAFF 240422]
MKGLPVETANHAPRRDVRGIARAILLLLTYALALLVCIIQGLTLYAGSSVEDGRITLSSLSIVQFDGIIPSSTSDSYLVRIHLFFSSLGYEHPSASTAGVVSSWPRLPHDLMTIGEQLDVPSSAWACLVSGSECTSPFYRAFRSGYFDLPTETLTYFGIYYAFFFIGVVLLKEILISVRPSWLRCRCYFGFLKRKCSCPRGTREEIEALPSAFWDGYRMWLWPTMAFAAFTPAHLQFLNGWVLKTHVNLLGLEGVNARFGRGFVVMQAVALGASFVAIGFLYLRKQLGSKADWMEQQGVLGGSDGTKTKGASAV